MIPIPPKAVRVKCKCGYRWNTISKMKLVSCPCCLKKTPNPAFDPTLFEASPADTSFLTSSEDNKSGGASDNQEKEK